MAIERTYYCEGPDCDPVRATTASPPPHLPKGFIEVRESCDNEDRVHHFHDWGCLMKFAADQPITQIIPWDEASDGE